MSVAIWPLAESLQVEIPLLTFNVACFVLTTLLYMSTKVLPFPSWYYEIDSLKSLIYRKTNDFLPGFKLEISSSVRMKI